MKRKTDKSHEKFIETETGTIRKSWRERIKIALVYPNRYQVGMSNLGFQTVYQMLNNIEYVVCERSFLPDDGGRLQQQITSIESGKPISDFDIIAFSVSFENDFPNILAILARAGLPLQSNNRVDPHPLIIAGGVACFLNPEPIAPFIDCFLIGEAETLLPQFVAHYYEIGFESNTNKKLPLISLAQNVPGTYVPAFYEASYNTDGTLCFFQPVAEVPEKIERNYVKDLSHVSTCSTLLTPHTTFDRTFLIEVARGCPHGCRFCSAGYIYRPPRFRPLSLLEECLEQGAGMSNKIGLMGAAVSDLPDIKALCSQILQKDIRISFSSLRADSLSSDLISVLKQSKIKTATIAPDAGSERMRRVINKGITEANILDAVETFVANGIPNLKLYFMVGLPTETIDDVEAVVKLCKKIKQQFLKSSRIKKRIGTITVSLNSFVPKPFTPFQWFAMDEVKTLREKIKRIKDGLKGVANVSVKANNLRWAQLQGLFSRGDRRVAQILSLANTAMGNWAKSLKNSTVDPDFYVYRERSTDELLPWDFIDHGIDKSFLKREYNMAKQSKTSPPCSMESTCTICGVCRKDVEITEDNQK